MYLTRNNQEASAKTSLPAIGLKLDNLVEKLQACYNLTTNGKFCDSIVKFRQILLSIPFLVVNTKQEVNNNKLGFWSKKYFLG